MQDSRTATPQVRLLRKRLVTVGKILWKEKFVNGSEGNISARIPKTDLVLIKPTGTCMGKLKPEDLIVVDLYGNKTEGMQKPSTETPMHTMIYRTRTDIEGVIHTHSMVATAFGIADQEIPPVWLRSASLLKGVPVVKHQCPGSIELARAVARKLKNRNAALLQNHGAVVVGQSIEEACRLAIALEDTAKIQLMAMLIGKPRILSKNDISEMMRPRE